jgi:hypothetical protein
VGTAPQRARGQAHEAVDPGHRRERQHDAPDPELGGCAREEPARRATPDALLLLDDGPPAPLVALERAADLACAGRADGGEVLGEDVGARDGERGALAGQQGHRGAGVAQQHHPPAVPRGISICATWS